MTHAGPRRHRKARLWNASLPFVLAACLVAAGAALGPGVASARTVARGIADTSIVRMSPGDQAAALHEISSPLGATSVRFLVSWALAEPSRGAYDPASPYMSGVASAVAQAKADGLKVIITFTNVPKWASDPVYWPDTGGYTSGDAMSRAYLPDFQAFCRHVASLLHGEVYAYECWNEPNLFVFLYPQATTTDPHFGAHLYVAMLKRCSLGVRAGDSAAQVVAGATSPYGSSGANPSTCSPLRFARVIKAAGVGSCFDAYSHHPYMPGASPHLAPEAAPLNPQATVTLQDLGSLLKLFPSKPFLLTEYGIQTSACVAFAGQHVSEATQASYLTRAYAYVARYPQVKLLMWYLLKDQRPQPPAPADRGFYTALRRADGTPKPSWYAFARGNHLSLLAPSSIKRGATLTLRGRASNANVGGVAGIPLVVQRRLNGGSWSTLKTVRSAAANQITNTQAGLYTLQLRPTRSASYRVVWGGVVTSSTRSVSVK
jgi:hypothetical protein